MFSLFSPDLPSSGFTVPSRRRAKQPTGCQPEGRPPRGRACRPLGRRNESRWATKRRLGWVKFRPLMWFKSRVEVKLREQLDLLKVVKKESQLDYLRYLAWKSHLHCHHIWTIDALCFFHQGWRWTTLMGRSSATLRLRSTWPTPAGTPAQLLVRGNASLLPLCYSLSKPDFKFLWLQKQRDRNSRLSSPPPCVDLFYFFHSAACRAAFRSICSDHGVLNRLEI